MAPTYEISATNYTAVLHNIVTNKVVLKPQFGSEGKGIYIVTKDQVGQLITTTHEPYFAQQFLDASAGVPGLVKGLHDLRVIIFNGKLKHSFIQLPKQGSYLANLAQGGTFVYVAVATLPISTIKLVEQIDNQFAQYPLRLYAIDIMYEHGKPYLVELNDQPGLPYLEENKFDNSTTRYHQDLLTILTGK